MPERLPSQPPAQPPSSPVAEPPSLLVYATLSALAVILVVIGFETSDASPSWSSLSLNLATELIGAVAILIVVERRLRPSDLTALGRVGEGVARRVLFVMSREARQFVSYATVLSDRVAAAAMRPYLDRGLLEEQVLAESVHGVVVRGTGGAGKTTLLHQLALLTAAQLHERPRSATVPILVALRFWHGADLEKQTLRSVNRYARVSTRYLDKALRNGRALCLLDGFDEVLRPHDAVRSIQQFRARFPRAAIVVTTRDGRLLEETGFRTIDIPALTDEEAMSLFS